MSDIAIHTEGLGKTYVIDEGRAAPGRGRITDLLARRRGARREVRALDDVSIDVRRGEIVGCIGRNGAGKTTLLKLLTRITRPTAGRAVVRGRVGALLEVGTGFSYELTGRENIYLNGAILGMRRAEIRARFDEIVAYADIGPYLDTPVKRYSSGMFMRLGFAVAAHLRTEILLVDEVLAVGDAAFQRKCLAKMEDIAGSGRTVLFVSHNLGAVRELCTRGIHIDRGRVACDDTVERALESYTRSFADTPADYVNASPNPALAMEILGVAVTRGDGARASHFFMGEPIALRIRYRVARPMSGTNLAVQVKRNGATVFTSFDTDDNPALLEGRAPGEHTCVVTLPADNLKAGFYTISIDCGMLNISAIDTHRDAVTFTIDETGENTARKSYAARRVGMVRLPVQWNDTPDTRDDT